MKKTQEKWQLRLIVVGILALMIGTVTALGQTDAEQSIAETDGYDPFVLASQTLGITESELDTQLEAGKTLAQLARDLSIDPDSLVQTIRQADAAEADLALSAGEIDELEAAEWRDFSYVFAVEFVYLPLDDMFWGELDEVADWDDWDDFDEAQGFGEFEDFGEFFEPSGFADFNPFEAELFGLLPYDMAIESQRTMAYSLLDYGVEAEAVVDSILESEESLLNRIIGFAVGPFDFGAWEEDVVWEDEILEVVGEQLGMDEDALWLALEDGSSIADLAEANAVDPQALIDQLMTREEEWIAELLADEELTETEAAEWSADSLEMIQELINEPWF